MSDATESAFCEFLDCVTMNPVYDEYHLLFNSILLHCNIKKLFEEYLLPEKCHENYRKFRYEFHSFMASAEQWFLSFQAFKTSPFYKELRILLAIIVDMNPKLLRGLTVTSIPTSLERFTDKEERRHWIKPCDTYKHNHPNNEILEEWIKKAKHIVILNRLLKACLLEAQTLLWGSSYYVDSFITFDDLFTLVIEAVPYTQLYFELKEDFVEQMGNYLKTMMKKLGVPE